MITRRSMLKILALFSGSPLLSNSVTAELLAGNTKPYTYLLLHGMFFMEFYDGLFYICTPKYDCHKFFKKTHAPNPTSFQSLDPDINWSKDNSMITPGKTNSFPPEVLQFSVKTLDPNGLPILPGAKNYACKMVLHPPKHIFGYRTDGKEKFHPLTGNTADDISDSTGPRIATITCLQYDPGKAGAFVESFYAEHDHLPRTSEVNDALQAAKGICGNNFDLKFDPSSSNPSPADKDKPGSLPPGIDPDYETEINEKPGTPCPPPKPGAVVGTENVDVASCPQFGINH
jgi:hypothetical protein